MTPNNSDQAAMLPCPFCGSVADHKEWSDAGYHCISCADCDVAMDYFHTKREAIAAWNRRAPSQPPALHDELRARLPALPAAVAGTGAIKPNMAHVRIPLKPGSQLYTADQMHDYAIAALSPPASEAVAPLGWWDHFNEHLYRDKVSADNAAVGGNLVTPLYTTPQPPPAAHAGGEAVAWRYRDASQFGDTEWRYLDLPPLNTYATVEALYTHPSPMPVDALRELRDGAVCDLGSVITDFSYDMSDKAFSSLLDAAQKITDALTALLSGGAAREEAK